VRVEPPGTMYVLRSVHVQTQEVMECNGAIPGNSLKIDKFGNLHFIRGDKEAIMRIPNSDLMKVFNLKPRQGMPVMTTNITCETLYSNETTSYIYSLNGITIEREYLYWTNNPKDTH